MPSTRRLRMQLYDWLHRCSIAAVDLAFAAEINDAGTRLGSLFSDAGGNGLRTVAQTPTRLFNSGDPIPNYYAINIGAEGQTVLALPFGRTSARRTWAYIESSATATRRLLRQYLAEWYESCSTFHRFLRRNPVSCLWARGWRQRAARLPGRNVGAKHIPFRHMARRRLRHTFAIRPRRRSRRRN